MTGYGAAERIDRQSEVKVELRALNNRFTDFSFNLPTGLSALEDNCRKLLQAFVKRGKVEVLVRYRLVESPGEYSLDADSLSAIIGLIGAVKRQCGDPEPIKAADVLKFPGIVGNQTIDQTKAWQQIEPVFLEALGQMDRQRQAEGQAVKKDLQTQLAAIQTGRQRLSQIRPTLEAAFKINLQQRLGDLLTNPDVVQRILPDLVSLLSRYAVHEELERLNLHVQAAAELVCQPTAIGKRLDFLAQEMHREVNTIGSKCADYTVGATIIELKEAIEVIREQVRNIE